MTFVNAQKSRLLIGSLAYSAYARTAETQCPSDMLDVTVLEDTAFKYIPGQSDSTFNLDVIFDTDTTAGGLASSVGSWKAGAAQPLSFGPNGWTALSEVQMMYALQSGFTVSSSKSTTVDGHVSAQGTAVFSMGYSLEDLAAITQDTTGTARDLTASSTSGGIAHLHVTAFSGLTSDVITIEHSVDGSTSWATLVTFATVTGTTSERVVVASGTTIRRYLRVVDDVTGTGSITRQVSFSRG